MNCQGRQCWNFIASDWIIIIVIIIIEKERKSARNDFTIINLKMKKLWLKYY